MDVEKFVLGKDRVPDWFNEQALKGRAKLIRDPDTDELIGATVFSPTKTIKASIGDVLMNFRSGISVVPKEKAAKYMSARKGPADGKSDKETV